METRGYQIELSSQDGEMLRELAANTGKSAQEIVSSAIRQYQESVKTPPEPAIDGKSLFDMLNEQGLIGCLKGGPADLSTNPIYMKGFGE